MAREPFAVGRLRGTTSKVARKCAWCGRWFTPGDLARYDAGCPVTHGMCHWCARRIDGDTPDAA